MRKSALPLLLLLAISIAACRSSGDKASFDQVEESRQRARENVTHLVETWQKANNFEGYQVDVRVDPTIGPECLQGDGWAEAALVNNTTHQTVRLLKCSTVSPTLGCMTSGTFDGTDHKREEGTCNTTLAAPLPRLR